MPYADPERRREYHKEYHKKHRAEIIERAAEWHRSHREQYNANQRRRYQGNRAAQRERSRNYHSENINVARNSTLKRKYGITLAEYNALVSTQCGSCAICGVVPCENPDISGRNQKRLHVDHDHKTGRVRGLLCSGRNRGIGALKEDIKVLNHAALYLTDNE